jgi:signal transduction histidine kinase
MGEKPPTWQNVKLAMLYGISHISLGDISHSLETENLEIFADLLLEKAFQGLFENTIEHGGQVSRIRVWYKETHDGAVLVFENDGAGIPEDQKERIFLRGEGTRSSIRGLFFVREILDLTGITIQESGDPVRGVRFEITVPQGVYRLADIQ